MIACSTHKAKVANPSSLKSYKNADNFKSSS